MTITNDKRTGAVALGAVMLGLAALLAGLWWISQDASDTDTVALIPSPAMLESSGAVTDLRTGQDGDSLVRHWSLGPPVDPIDPAPGDVDPPMVWFITHGGPEVDPDLLHDFEAAIEPIEVRGIAATAGVRAPGYYAVLVWEEAPGVWARLRYGPSDDPVAEAVEVANALVAVDQDGWRQFSEEHGGS